MLHRPILTASARAGPPERLSVVSVHLDEALEWVEFFFLVRSAWQERQPPKHKQEAIEVADFCFVSGSLSFLVTLADLRSFFKVLHTG